jgi:monoamine oxidase
MNEARSLKVVIIGAGAAGLAAARELVRVGVDTLVVEARNRIGGRAWTVSDGPCPLDLGCGWLHSADRNPWGRIAEDLGFTVDRTPPAWGRQHGDIGFSPTEQAEFHVASRALYERTEAAALTGIDRPASTYLEVNNPWNPLLNAVGTYIHGVELDRVSIIDYGRYSDSEVNWRIREGYGAAIAAFGQTVPVRLNCAVSVIDHAGRDIRLVTSQGDIAAQKVIVTVPPSVIAAERLRFSPTLPEKLAASHGLPLGVANKLMLEVTEPRAWPRDGHVIGHIDRVGTGSYHLRPLGRPTVEGYFGGELAKELEEEGLAAFTAFALDELAGLFGAAVRTKLKPMVSTAWHADFHSLGSYSCALPGHADDRACLAAPVDGRLFFAGEACSQHDFSTAHGAYMTGIAAARALLGMG